MAPNRRSRARLAQSLAACALAATLAAVPAAAGPKAGATATPAALAYPANGNIYLINSDGSNQHVLIAGRPGRKVDHWGGIAWSRDGKKLAFTVGNHAQGQYYGETLRLYTAAGDGTNIRPLTSLVGAFDPSWSPDGSQLAFAIHRSGETAIAVVGANGQGLRTLVRSTAPDVVYWVPDWSPDGTQIMFEIARVHGIRTSLMTVAPDGSGLRTLATFKTGNHCLCADWSPDGSRIAFQAPSAATPHRYGFPEIWVMAKDASHRVQLTRNLVRDENPDWSPNGSTLAFYSERAGNAEIYTVPVAGGQAHRVTHDPWYDGPPRWRPLG